MEFTAWTEHNWFDLLQTVAIIGNSVALIYTIRKDDENRKSEKVISVTQQHSDIWGRTIGNPALSRIKDRNADLESHPLTDDEFVFVRQLILNAQNVFFMMRSGLFPNLEGMERDIRDTLSLPIPNAVWKEIMGYQNIQFVEFVENALKKETLK